MATIYDNVAARAKELKMPIYKLEKAAGIGNASIRRWKQSSPQVDTLRKVAAVLDCTIDDLIDEN